MENEFQCIHCGFSAENLYHNFKAGITKVANCKNCGKIVDKYVEYDATIILLDMLLLQKSAYVHLLVNVNVKSHWRSTIILWVVEAFVKLIQQRSDQGRSQLEANIKSYVGLDLYLNYFVAVVGLMSFLLSTLFILAVRSYLLTQSLKLLNSFFVTKAILLTNLGSVLVMPAILWGKSYSPALVWLGQAFVCASAFQALQVVILGRHKTFLAAVAVICGMSLRTLLSDWLNQWLHSYFFAASYSTPS